MMKRRILQTIVALLAIADGATAQTLSVASVEATKGGQTELVVSASGMTGVTALQFNLALPQGITLNESAITKGEAASGHTLLVQTLDNGDRLVVIYHTDLGLVSNGTLLRLPITVGQQTGSFSGSLYTVRTANTEAVSQSCDNATFTMTVTEPPVTVKMGDVNGDGEVNEVDAQLILDVSVGLKELNDLRVPAAINVPGGNSNALEVNAQIVLDYSVASVKPW